MQYRLQVTLLSENTYEIFSILDQVGSKCGFEMYPFQSAFTPITPKELSVSDTTFIFDREPLTLSLYYMILRCLTTGPRSYFHLLCSLNTLWGRWRGFFEESIVFETNPFYRAIDLAGHPNTLLVYFPFLYSYKELNLDLILIRDVC